MFLSLSPSLFLFLSSLVPALSGGGGITVKYISTPEKTKALRCEEGDVTKGKKKLRKKILLNTKL